MSDDPASQARKRLGTVIKGKYRLDDVLGVGGMAVVYRATHRNQKELAIKMLHPEVSHQDEIRKRFLREGYAANSIKHPGVVSVVDDDVTDDGAAFLVMELLEGATVEDIVAAAGGTLQADIACAIAVRVLEILGAAHGKGIFHRDIKPANLFVTTTGEVKLLDFGIARVRDAATGTSVTLTGAGLTFGTPAFMSPEQALGNTKEIDERCDIWQVGATLYAILTGRFVHLAETPQHQLVLAATTPPESVAVFAPQLSPAVVAAVDRALAFDKNDRWPSADAMRSALEPDAATCTREALAAVGARVCASVQTSRAQAPANAAAEQSGATFHAVTQDGRTSARRRIGALAVASALLVAATSLVWIRWHDTAAPASPTVLGNSATATPQAPTERSAVVEPVPTTTTSESPKATPIVNVAPKKSAHTVASVTAAPPPLTTTSSTESAAECNPPFWIDGQGAKHFKNQCFRP